MRDHTITPYGSWKSPITSAMVAAGSLRLFEIRLEGQQVYWIEGRPEEGGRYVIVRWRPDGQKIDVTPPGGFSARSRVHEYGGGSYLVDDETICFTNFNDQRLYRQTAGDAPVPLTPDGRDVRYADAVMDSDRNRLICVREEHSPGCKEPVNTIVAVALGEPNEGKVLSSGSDFYAAPRLSPNGRQLAWLSWNHPNMPWDGTKLWLATVEADGSLREAECVAGGEAESVFQPEWSPDGLLHFVSDRTGWWNIYRMRDGRIEPLCKKPAEFGLPQWVFALSTYGFESAESIVCTYREKGLDHLARLDTRTLELSRIDVPYTNIGSLRVGDDCAAFIGGSPSRPAAVVRLELETGRSTEIRQSAKVEVGSGYLAVPQPVEFPTEEGLTAHGFYYPPTNQDHSAPADELPPLLVKSHGGPTSATSAVFNLGLQYWTSRGVAVLDVNYGGSTGYGREYRQRLNGKWGIVDVDDCANGARYLVAKGLADGDRLCIDGGSAGGYTTLAALTFRETFQAGASFYGVSDLEALARETHKFESRYLERLVGRYPEEAEVYRERSPIRHVERLSCPVIFFQGDEDKIVPPNQAELMVAALKAKRIPVAYLLFEGEQHGFRKAENIRRALEGEFGFFANVFGFTPADPIEPVPIEEP